MDPPAVLHVMSPLGGGVDRHVRDIVSQVGRRHVLWHVGERAEVVEVEGTPRFHPIDPARIAAAPESLAGWLRSLGIGLVHLHTVVRAPRERAAWAAQRLGLPLLVTLHDVLFQRPDAFEFHAPPPDGPWVAEVAPVLRSAKAVLAPSGYLATLAGQTFPGLKVEVVPNGFAANGAEPVISVRARDEFLAHRPARVVAVLGAIGTHKGADMLRELPA
nr:glycosyltransferase [Pseudomonadota bacterium]